MDGSEPLLTKIIATVGPATREPAVLRRLIEEGVRVVRINFSHGTIDDFDHAAEAVRDAARTVGVPVAILGDLSGPKIRLNQIDDDPLEIAVGERVELVRGVAPARRDGQHPVRLTTTYASLVDELEPGQRVLIDDGAVRMLVVELSGEGAERRAICRVVAGGPVSTRKGVNLPDTQLSLPSLTDHDQRCLEWAAERRLDFLALSFVRSANDIESLSARIEEVGNGWRPPIIAKIEKPQAVDALPAICDAADGLMVARGDLGVEMDLARVPIVQKQIVREAHRRGKPVIVATQMLQSMIQNSSPTRAEVSDVANAILDGADAVMLSGETAIGRYPVQTVLAMAQTARMTERYLAETSDEARHLATQLGGDRYRTAALAHGVSVIVRDLRARFVVLWSERGGGARYLSRHRLHVPVIAVSSSDIALRRMCLMYGVTPLGRERPVSSDAFVEDMDRHLREQRLARQGDPILILTGEPLGTAGVTNQIRLHYVGDVCRLPEADARHGRPLP